MAVPSQGRADERPRTMVHPGPRAELRLEHVAASGARQMRIALTAGTNLHEGLTQALAATGVLTEVQEILPAGWSLSSASCVDAANAGLSCICWNDSICDFIWERLPS